MFCLVLVCSSLLALAPEDSAPDPSRDADLKTYETLRDKVGQDSPAHVKLALWCEAHGLDAERLKHLALAVLTDPKNATARGFLGLIAYRERWERPEQVSRRIEADAVLTAKLAEYNARREKLLGRIGEAGRSPKVARAASAAHDALGVWCKKNQLDAEAKAHFTSAAVLDPYNEAPWKHLGYVKSNGRWMSREQLAAEEREATAQSRADRRWEPLLKQWRADLATSDKRVHAQEQLDAVADPRAAAAIVRVFRDGDPAHEALAVNMLAKITTPVATRALAELAVLSKTQAVRSAAIDALRSRTPREYVGMLVDQIHAPMRYQFEPVRGPGSPGALVIETPRFKMLRTYDAPEVFQPGPNFYGYVGYDANGMPVIIQGKELRRLSMEASPNLDIAALERRTLGLIAAANMKAAASQQQMLSDVSAIEQANAQTDAVNTRIATSLQGAADAPQLDPGDEHGWQRWRYDQLGYRYDPPAQTQIAVSGSSQSPAPSIKSCFVAGTPVRTIHGLRPIESLQVGDQVLSQDTTRGTLTFQPVMVVHHNPPGSTLRLELDNGETLVPSIYHRFWRAGRGWAIARDLKPGDFLRTLEGRTRIKTISPGPTAPVFNLDVAESRTFFVGDHGALVHDNTFPASPTTPFDAEPVF